MSDIPLVESVNTCKRQWLGIGELFGLHSLLLFLQSCQHVSQVQLDRGFALLPCCFGECLLQGVEMTNKPVKYNSIRMITAQC